MPDLVVERRPQVAQRETRSPLLEGRADVAAGSSAGSAGTPRGPSRDRRSRSRSRIWPSSWCGGGLRRRRRHEFAFDDLEGHAVLRCVLTLSVPVFRVDALNISNTDSSGRLVARALERDSRRGRCPGRRNRLGASGRPSTLRRNAASTATPAAVVSTVRRGPSRSGCDALFEQRFDGASRSARSPVGSNVETGSSAVTSGFTRLRGDSRGRRMARAIPRRPAVVVTAASPGSKTRHGRRRNRRTASIGGGAFFAVVVLERRFDRLAGTTCLEDRAAGVASTAGRSSPSETRERAALGENAVDGVRDDAPISSQ